MKKLDGHLDLVRKEDVKPGVILRFGHTDDDGSFVSSPFSEHIIVRVWRPTDTTPLQARLVRPYAWVHLTGTTSPGPLFGAEDYIVPVDRLVGAESLFRLVLMSDKKP